MKKLRTATAWRPGGDLNSMTVCLALEPGIPVTGTEITMKGDVTQEQLAHLLRELETRCPVSDTRARRAFPLQVALT
ncbi:hypothetical protein KH5H1_53400 [Corallococcus caeni]|uniref:hypothetical protein n=1 Tax=Corallococcus caeni TaxID=3082388 RepID=UPI0029581822|nr:hypothetical protein KH5H1_53400 [Corallococcus sp. KH5-1]